MWTRIKTRIMNALGFWTMAQIAGQYVSPQANYRDEIKQQDDYRRLTADPVTKSYVDRILATGPDFYDYDYMETAFRRKR